MKLYRVMKEHKLRQSVFYGWLRDGGLIQKGENGYEVGEKAFAEMETIHSREAGLNGEILREQTQVGIAEEAIPKLLAMYEESGLPNRYQQKKERDMKEARIMENLQEITYLLSQLQKDLHLILEQTMKAR